MKDEKIITVTLEGKTYKAIYNGKSSKTIQRTLKAGC